MSQYDVTFLPYNRKITVNGGKTLIRAAMEAGVHPATVRRPLPYTTVHKS